MGNCDFETAPPTYWHLGYMWMEIYIDVMINTAFAVFFRFLMIKGGPLLLLDFSSVVSLVFDSVINTSSDHLTIAQPLI